MILTSPLCAERGTLSMTWTIILVEDQSDVAHMLQEVLEIEGYQVTVFYRSDGVVEQVTEIRPDAVLIDLLLPGTSGIALAQDVRRQGYAGPLIAMSASRPMMHLARRCGLFIDTLDKPFDLQLLFGTLHRSMEQDTEGHGCWMRARPREISPRGQQVRVDTASRVLED
jgi:DNA-binding response OmpR family regulator